MTAVAVHGGAGREGAALVAPRLAGRPGRGLEAPRGCCGSSRWSGTERHHPGYPQACRGLEIAWGSQTGLPVITGYSTPVFLLCCVPIFDFPFSGISRC